MFIHSDYNRFKTRSQSSTTLRPAWQSQSSVTLRCMPVRSKWSLREASQSSSPQYTNWLSRCYSILRVAKRMCQCQSSISTGQRPLLIKASSLYQRRTFISYWLDSLTIFSKNPQNYLRTTYRSSGIRQKSIVRSYQLWVISRRMLWSSQARKPRHCRPLALMFFWFDWIMNSRSLSNPASTSIRAIDQEHAATWVRTSDEVLCISDYSWQMQERTRLKFLSLKMLGSRCGSIMRISLSEYRLYNTYFYILLPKKMSSSGSRLEVEGWPFRAPTHMSISQAAVCPFSSIFSSPKSRA